MSKFESDLKGAFNISNNISNPNIEKYVFC